MLDFFFNLFRGPQDPTSDWQKSSDLQLQFNLDTGALNTACLGDNYEAASFLGPSDDRREAAGGMLQFHALGICVESDGDWNIAEWHLVYRDEEARFLAYSGKIWFRGTEVDLANATEQSFRAQFGECYWRGQDDDETILFYEFPQLEWQVEFDPRGLINGVRVTDRILMAKEEQRKAYGVTKTWPPQFS